MFCRFSYLQQHPRPPARVLTRQLERSFARTLRSSELATAAVSSSSYMTAKLTCLVRCVFAGASALLPRYIFSGT